MFSLFGCLVFGSDKVEGLIVFLATPPTLSGSIIKRTVLRFTAAAGDDSVKMEKFSG